MRLIAPIFTLLILQGCASMSADECLTANWELIGLEDGSQGYELAKIGRHRKACAEHGVSPDLQAYEIGHKRGVRTYCTWDKGFAKGKSGGDYNGICPADLEIEFVSGLSSGREIYDLNRQLQATRSDMAELEDNIVDIEDDIIDKEDLIVSETASPDQRRTLLAEIETLRAELLDHGIALGELMAQQDILELDLQVLEAQY